MQSHDCGTLESVYFGRAYRTNLFAHCLDKWLSFDAHTVLKGHMVYAYTRHFSSTMQCDYHAEPKIFHTVIKPY